MRTENPKGMNIRAPRQKFDPSVRRFLRDQRGSAITMFAVVLMAAAGFAAIAIDGGYLYSLKSKLQSTADAAVLVAVSELPDTVAARTAAIGMAGKNMPLGEHGAVLADADVVTGNWDTGTRAFTAGGTPLNAVRVVTRRSQVNGNAVGLFFARILGLNQVDVETAATARMTGRPLCILALDPSAPGAFDMDNGIVSTDGCEVRVNSSDPVALKSQNNGELYASSICVTGGFDGNGTVSPAPQTGCAPTPDPLAGLAPPPVGPCDYTNMNVSSGSLTLTPGVYCGGLSVTGSSTTVTLQPGTYVFKDGELKVAGSSIFQGDGVTLYFTGTGAVVTLTGTGDIDLSGPTTGPLAGVVMFQDRNAAAGQEHRLRGNGNVSYEGTIYFPTGDVRMTGGNSITPAAPYSSFIARRFMMGSGTFAIASDYESSNVPLPDGLSGGGGGSLVQ